MQTYLVGGAVRDELLALPVKDRDWVVVGATPSQMLDQGFQQVGSDFPVFLHPDTKEEYALARIERKAGRGYRGFVCDASADVSLEDDLLRRDLTINAIAQDADGAFIDPYSGLADIEGRVLRHVSDAFVEDPLRVLRVARFAARFAPLGFSIAPDTMALMRSMAQSGELDTLVAERVWQELHAALISDRPDVFIETLREAGALKTVLPELDALFGVPQTEQYHPEVDTGVHMLMVMQQAALLGLSPAARYACLLHDLGKGITPKEEWPRHIAHERRSARLADKVSKRLKVPADYARLATVVGEWHLHCHRALELNAKSLLSLFQRLDCFRRPEWLTEFVMACKADARGRKGFEQRDYPQASYLVAALQCCTTVDVSVLQKQGFSGPELGQAISEQRLRSLKDFIKRYRENTNA
ncbi:MAG: multifunctional CCA addition/repair protein [Pseudomonadota bacterium]